ncbi:MAG TPA: nuclear transport factor 2 family protein [Gaiellales bacterium]|jgi:hypothetical protein
MAVETQGIDDRLRLLEAKEEIRNLLQEYRRTLDVRDLRAFSALFAANGSWAGASGEATGPEGIYTMLTGALSENPPWPGATLWHLITDPAIAVDGERATASSLWMHVRRGEGDTPLLPTLGVYEDELVVEDGAWRFLRRSVTRQIPQDPREAT